MQVYLSSAVFKNLFRGRIFLVSGLKKSWHSCDLPGISQVMSSTFTLCWYLEMFSWCINQHLYFHLRVAISYLQQGPTSCIQSACLARSGSWGKREQKGKEGSVFSPSLSSFWWLVPCRLEYGAEEGKMDPKVLNCTGLRQQWAPDLWS